jgi:hypothetical protein
VVSRVRLQTLFREHPQYFIVTVPEVDLRCLQAFTLAQTLGLSLAHTLGFNAGVHVKTHVGVYAKTHAGAVAGAVAGAHAGAVAGVHARGRCTGTAAGQMDDGRAGARPRRPRRHTTTAAAA